MATTFFARVAFSFADSIGHRKEHDVSAVSAHVNMSHGADVSTGIVLSFHASCNAIINRIKYTQLLGRRSNQTITVRSEEVPTMIPASKTIRLSLLKRLPPHQSQHSKLRLLEGPTFKL